MAQSESIGKLVAALSAAQTEFDKITKNRVGQEGNQRFPYSTLSQVLEAVRPPLNKQGIFLSQPIIVDAAGGQRVTTKVQLGDEFISTDGVLLSPGLIGGKQFGKESTYARRYDLNAFLSVCAEDDDEDAHDLKKPAATPLPPQNKPLNPYPPAKTTTQFPNKLPNNPEAALKIAQEKAFKKEAFKETKSSPTDFNFGNNVSNVPENGNQSARTITPDGTEITDADLPQEMFSEKVSVEQPLSAEAENAASNVDAPQTLSQERHTYIQDRLKELVTQKKFSTKAVSGYLEARHNGKKLVYVPSVTAENTLKLIEEAVEAGPAAIKELFNGVKNG